MDEIKELFSMDVIAVISGVCLIIFSIEKLGTACSKIKGWLGFKTKANIREEQFDECVDTVNYLKTQRETDVKQSIAHDKRLEEKINVLGEKVDILADSLSEMRELQHEDKRAEYKDKISQSYRDYRERKFSDDTPVPFWNSMEKEALEGLVKQYESHGGKNSFVHSIVEKEMQTWKLV